MSFTYKQVAFIALTLFTITSSEGIEANKNQDNVKDQLPFSAIEHHLSHYLWPWRRLFEAALAMDTEDEEPLIVSDSSKFQVNMNVKSFDSEELQVKVKNRHMVVEGNHKASHDYKNAFIANHFIQRFVLPPGTNQDEVTAVLKENGVLSITVPKHRVPPPPPERVVPITVLLPETTTKKEELKTTVTTEKPEKPLTIEPLTSTKTPLEQLEIVESTTHVGKIRKKELKTEKKTTKDNEVSKGLVEVNGLDYALVETE